jgi:DNA helicase-2/ATP-dependent DNA helicase PcrA
MVDEYQDTNRPQYLLIKRLAECTATSRSSAIPISRSTSGAAPTCEHPRLRARLPRAQDRRLEQNYRSTQVILDAATAVISQNRNRKDKRLWTDRKGGAKIVYFRGNDELEEADFIARRSSRRARTTSTRWRVLYRTNAQSRAIEDSLMRESIPTRSSAASASTSARKSRTRSPTSS